MFQYSLLVAHKYFHKFLLKGFEQPNMGHCLWDSVFNFARYPTTGNTCVSLDEYCMRPPGLMLYSPEHGDCGFYDTVI